MKSQKVEIEIAEDEILRWPDGWPRTLIRDRKSRPQWKKTTSQYREALIGELMKLGATAAKITQNIGAKANQDPGVAVWYSLEASDDSSWQQTLQIDNPAPTIAEIDAAFRRLVGPHHPDRIANGSGGDEEVFKKLRKARDAAKKWIIGGSTRDSYEHCIPCDRFNEPRLNLAGIRLALGHFRGLDRVGIPSILERVMGRAFAAGLLTDQKEYNHVAATA